MEATNGGGDPRSPTELALAVGQRSEVDKRQKKLQNTGKSVENHWKISRFTDFLLGRRQISGNRQLKQKRLISGFSYSTSLAVILFKTKLKKTRLLFRQSLTRRSSAENLTWKPSKSASLIIPYQALQQDNSANEWPNHGFRLDLRMDLFQAKKITNRRLKQYKSNELTIKHPVKSLLNHHVIIHSSNNPNK